jgi:hypothetical protein
VLFLLALDTLGRLCFVGLLFLALCFANWLSLGLVFLVFPLPLAL